MQSLTNQHVIVDDKDRHADEPPATDLIF
jgi:hypothetical protein